MRPGDVAFERFEIERRAGSGAMGTVYRARDRRSGETVALKVLAGREAIDAERFAREAAVLAALTHPAIVRYVAHGTGPVGGGRASRPPGAHPDELSHYLAMEWLEGEDLAARLGRQGVDVPESVRMMRRVSEALAVAHRVGVVHRDIKPSNLFLVGGDIDRVKLLDFGIARLTREGRGVTLTGAMLGTPGYMSPEQAQGSRDIDARADVFSLGCVLFKCLTGRAPYSGDNILSVLAKTIIEDAPRLSDVRPDVPPDLDELVSRLLAKDKSARPMDGASVAAALGALRPDASAPAGPASNKDAALTGNERRVMCVLLVGGPAGMSEGAATLSTPHAHARELALQETVESHGGHLDFLADGSLLVTVSSDGAATDTASRAARCALELRALLPEVAMVLVTGGVLSAAITQDGLRPPPGSDLVDRGVSLLERGAAPAGVWLDDATAGLLDVRFDVRGAEGTGESVLYLHGERDMVEATRTLLGRPYPCVGRDRELAFLQSVFEECESEPIARAVLITAPAGRGKSRVRFELMERLREKHGERALVLFGRGDSMSAGSPFGMLAPAIRRSAGILDGDPLEVKHKRLRARVARTVGSGARATRTAEFLGEMVSVPFADDQSAALRAARGDAMLMGDGMMAAWLEWLEAETLQQPVLLVLEDLHWGDLPTVRYVDAALGRLPTRPLMVLALARPEVHTHFPGLWEERELQEIRLGPLTPKASERLAREVLGPQVKEETLTRVVERAGGNAFYLEELIRAVAGGAESKLLPDSVLGMVQARLDALGAEAKRLLRAASVFGQVFWQGGVTALLGGGARAGGVKEWLDELLAREVIASRGDARTFQDQAEYIFRHALLRDAAYAMLTDHDRVLGHRLAGAWLEKAGETDAMVLAEHFDRGGEPWRAIGWYRRAAEQALGGNDLDAAISRAYRGSALGKLAAERRSSFPPPDSARGDTPAISSRRPTALSVRREPERRSDDVIGVLRLIQTEAHKWRGDLADAQRCGEEAAARLPVAGDFWFRAVGEVIALAGQQGDVQRVTRWVEEASAATMQSEQLSAQVSCLCRGVMALLHAGERDLADALLAQIEKVAGEVGSLDRLAAARLHQTWASKALQEGHLGRALTEYAAGLTAFELAGDARNQALTRINLGVVYAELGDFGRAEEVLRQALSAAERMGLANVAAWALNNLGNVLGRVGARDEARAVLERAIATGKKQGNLRLEVSSRIYLSRVAAASGDLTTAEQEARSAAEAAQHVAPLRSPALAALARSLLVGVSDPSTATGQVSEARARAAEALALLDSLGSIEGEGLIRLVFAEALMASGERDASRGAIDAARARLLERAGRIEDDELRASFLTAVWENARTIELAHSWAE